MLKGRRCMYVCLHPCLPAWPSGDYACMLSCMCHRRRLRMHAGSHVHSAQVRLCACTFAGVCTCPPLRTHEHISNACGNIQKHYSTRLQHYGTRLLTECKSHHPGHLPVDSTGCLRRATFAQRSQVNNNFLPHHRPSFNVWKE